MHLQLSDQPGQLAGCQGALEHIRRPCKRDQHNVTDLGARTIVTIVMQATQDVSRTTAGRLQLPGSSTCHTSCLEDTISKDYAAGTELRSSAEESFRQSQVCAHSRLCT